MTERQRFVLLLGVFLAVYFLPVAHPRFTGGVLEAFAMLHEYAREHVLFCLVPALFIAGAMAAFLSSQAVIRYLGPESKKWAAYGVGAVSGGILAVCSCTVLPLFGGIYKRGAGLGPAVAFLYSGPAINVLAIVLTARVLGWEMGLARALGAVLFSVVIGVAMAFLFRREEGERVKGLVLGDAVAGPRSAVQTVLYFAVLVLILVFAAWGKPAVEEGFWWSVYQVKWFLVSSLSFALAVILKQWFEKDELRGWIDSTWDFTKKIIPLLFIGVLIAGFLMGRPGTDAGVIPARYIAGVVGGNGLAANLIASVVGAFMYFATLTEIPIVQGLMGAGMGKGPALALLLAGPALSLPNMLVINSFLGPKKTVAYVALVAAAAALAGKIFGAL